MLRHLPKGSIFRSYRIDKLVKERPYGDPLHRCSLTLTAVPLCPAGEALVCEGSNGVLPRKKEIPPRMRWYLFFMAEKVGFMNPCLRQKAANNVQATGANQHIAPHSVAHAGFKSVSSLR